MPTTPKQIPEITAIPTPTAGQETDIQTVVARESTYDTFKMSLAQIFTLATVSGAIKTALDGLSALIAGNTSSITSLGTTKLNKVGETRTGLTANRIIITNASGVEEYMTPWSDTEYIWFTAGIPTKKVPDGRIAGEIRMWSTDTAPIWWAICDGSALSRTTYAWLFAVIGTTYGAGNGSTTFNIPNLTGSIAVGKQSAVSKGAATITIATPGVITNTGHWLANGNKVYFTTTGALPTGLWANTRYYVINATANTFQLSATINGTAINTTGTQSGTHTLFSANFDTLGSTGGEVNHTLSVDEMPSHSHNVIDQFGGGSNFNVVVANDGSWAADRTYTTPTTGWNLSHNNLPPYITLHYIIAY